VSPAPGIGNIRQSLHGQWSSRLAFILAVTGSAVGLGNIWRFPYIVGENGGGAFVLVYLVCVFAIGLPIMMAEILIGRRGRRNPVKAMSLLAEEEGSSRHWGLVGAMGVLAGFIILSFYSVIAGWSVAYVFESAAGRFMGADVARISGLFEGLLANWPRVVLWHTVFMIMTVAVVARGVEKGLERAVRVLVPALVGILVLLLFYAITSGGFAEGLRFLFEADFSRLTGTSVLIALGQAFFTLSLGMGAIMAYGAYLPEDTSIGGTAFTVVLADTGIAMLAGLVIFPIVFANGLDTAQGPGLVFITLPLAFGTMPGGLIFGTLFFLLLTFAAWTSAIGLIEPAVAYMVERLEITRALAAIIVGLVIWVLGLGSVLSFNVLADVQFGAGTFFDNADYVTSNLMLPLGGLLITLFAAYVVSRRVSAEELALPPALYVAWRVLARYVVPVAVVAVLLYALGLFG
jgi:NSS family neurotransmitter:Na+ symporter